MVTHLTNYLRILLFSLLITCLTGSSMHMTRFYIIFIIICWWWLLYLNSNIIRNETFKPASLCISRSLEQLWQLLRTSILLTISIEHLKWTLSIVFCFYLSVGFLSLLCLFAEFVREAYILEVLRHCICLFRYLNRIRIELFNVRVTHYWDWI